MGKSYKKVLTAYHTCTAADATATAVYLDIKSGCTTTTDAFKFVGMVKAQANGADKTAGALFTYSTTTGILTVANGGSCTLASGDLVTVMGIFGV